MGHMQMLNGIKQLPIWDRLASTQGLLLGIILLGFALRAARIPIEPVIDKDGVLYVEIANEMAQGRYDEAFGIMPRVPPLYVFLMSLGVKAGLGAEQTGVAVSLLAGTLLLLAVFFIARPLAGDKVALAAAFLAATHPYLIRDCSDVMRDPLFFFLLFSALALAVNAAGRDFSRLWYLSGVFAGLALLTRSEGNEILLGFLLWAAADAWLAFRKGELIRSLKKSLRCGLALLAGFLIVAVPVQNVLSKTASDWTLVDQRITSYYSSFFKLSEDEIVDQEK